MEMKKSKKFLVYLAVAYWMLVIMIYLVVGNQFQYIRLSSDALSASSVIGEIVDGMTVKQILTTPTGEMDSIELMAGTYDRSNTGTLHLTLTDEQGKTVAQKDVDIAAFENGKYTSIALNEPVEVQKGSKVTLLLETSGCTYGNAITIYSGNTITAGRFDVVKDIKQDDLYVLNDQPGSGMLCIKLNGIEQLNFYRWYWGIVASVFIAGALLCLFWWKEAKKGKNNPIVSICTLYTRYGFLIKQLVGRDFKTKYKRSILGMAWSFLNPLLTMLVQYIVFSTLFKNDIPNYAVYLLIGIVFMNFFNEAVSIGMTSITGNASLIKKVYMPKYIYPISRTVSSLVNFVISLIPLLIVMLITGLRPRPAILLLVFDILCLLGFVTGMCLLLTTAMTFFQDTQFLWGIASMMWTYLTPVFYPESIIPAKLITLYHANPMYQYITFARSCIIDGISPGPMAYLWCIISSGVVLLLGIVVFKRNQDKFVLYL